MTNLHLESIVCPNRDENQRNSEASVINLRDHRLLLAWTRFRGGSGSDFAPSDIATRTSADEGRTWSEPQIVATGNDAEGNVLSASLLRLGTGALALFYGRLSFVKKASYTKGDRDDISCPWHVLEMIVSIDEGATWSVPRRLNQPGEHSLVLLNDSAVRLSDGRLILPTYRGHSPYAPDPEFVQPVLSDDDGATWFPAACRLGRPGGDLSESSVIERTDGSLLMLSRTSSGFVYACESRDRGETWSQPAPTDLPASGTPTSLRRVPGSDDFVLLWNQVDTREWTAGFGRHRLTAAISHDGGATWRHRRNLESLDDRTVIAPEDGGPRGEAGRITTPQDQEVIYRELGLQPGGHAMAEYPSMIFVGDRAVITYDVVPAPGCALKLRILPVSWFYENE